MRRWGGRVLLLAHGVASLAAGLRPWPVVRVTLAALRCMAWAVRQLDPVGGKRGRMHPHIIRCLPEPEQVAKPQWRLARLFFESISWVSHAYLRLSMRSMRSYARRAAKNQRCAVDAVPLLRNRKLQQAGDCSGVSAQRLRLVRNGFQERTGLCRQQQGFCRQAEACTGCPAAAQG